MGVSAPVHCFSLCPHAPQDTFFNRLPYFSSFLLRHVLFLPFTLPLIKHFELPNWNRINLPCLSKYALCNIIVIINIINKWFAQLWEFTAQFAIQMTAKAKWLLGSGKRKWTTQNWFQHLQCGSLTPRVTSVTHYWSQHSFVFPKKPLKYILLPFSCSSCNHWS